MNERSDKNLIALESIRFENAFKRFAISLAEQLHSLTSRIFERFLIPVAGDFFLRRKKNCLSVFSLKVQHPVFSVAVATENPPLLIGGDFVRKRLVNGK